MLLSFFFSFFLKVTVRNLESSQAWPLVLVCYQFVYVSLVTLLSIFSHLAFRYLQCYLSLIDVFVLFSFRRFLQRTGILQVQEGGIIATIGVTTMVREKGTGTLIQSHELLGATIATKLRNQAQGQTGWQRVRIGLRGLGVLRDMTHSPHITLKTVHCAPAPHTVVPQMWHMACIRYQL